MKADLNQLQRRLDYRFNEISHLEHALTHRSAGARNNERLEFLGDAILGFEIADVLVKRHKSASEGELSRMRASLVKRETLAAIANELELGEFLTLGAGELRSGGHRRDSILADAVEAILAAVYRDGGLDESQKLIHHLFKKRINAVSPERDSKDPKTRLQEYLQAKKIDVPQYLVLSIEGEQHNQQFLVNCVIDTLSLKTIGSGKSRRKAEQQAAELMLEKVGAGHGK